MESKPGYHWFELLVSDGESFCTTIVALGEGDISWCCRWVIGRWQSTFSLISAKYSDGQYSISPEDALLNQNYKKGPTTGS
jgi:hypothetical protein